MFKLFKINQSSNVGGLLCLIVAVYLVYHLLVQDKLLPFCIDTALSSTHKPWHILMVGLVPIYISFTIFGAAILSLSLGAALQRWLSQYWQK